MVVVLFYSHKYKMEKSGFNSNYPLAQRSYKGEDDNNDDDDDDKDNSKDDKVYVYQLEDPCSPSKLEDVGVIVKNQSMYLTIEALVGRLEIVYIENFVGGALGLGFLNDELSEGNSKLLDLGICCVADRIVKCSDGEVGCFQNRHNPHMVKKVLIRVIATSTKKKKQSIDMLADILN